MLLGVSYNSWENVILFLKTEPRVLILWLDKSFAKGFRPKFPWTSFLAPGPKCQSFGIWKFFMWSAIKVWKNKLLFSNFWFGHFRQSFECLFPENCKKLFRNLLFGAISAIWLPSKSWLKKLVFWSTKIQISPEPLGQILKKWAHSEILSLRAFKWCKNQIILIKFQFWPTSL